MTQEELAVRTGVPRQTIVAIENGKYFPSLELSFRIANVFNVQLSDVFEYHPENDSILKKIKWPGQPACEHGEEIEKIRKEQKE